MNEDGKTINLGNLRSVLKALGNNLTQKLLEQHVRKPSSEVRQTELAELDGWSLALEDAAAKTEHPIDRDALMGLAKVFRAAHTLMTKVAL